jgi:ribosome biogenesis GTPase
MQRRRAEQGRPGTVVRTLGRRVLVRDDEGERVCFLSGQRAVVGDRVRWVEAPGEGGKIVDVLPRDTELARMDPKGQEQILAANLQGLLVVVSAKEPDFRRAMVDRYLVAAGSSGHEAAIVLTKVDLGVPDDVDAQVTELEGYGFPVLRVGSDGSEDESIAAFLASHDAGPWALVGSSGVGKTTLAARLLPEIDVGPVGEISEYWGTGKHTTTHTAIFDLPGGGALVDSPGIRNLTPAVTDAAMLRDHFPGLTTRCQYRDCLHREGEEGCAAEQDVPPHVLASYRHLLADVQGALGWRSPR